MVPSTVISSAHDDPNVTSPVRVSTTSTSIVSVYGADTARLFMISDSPPERDLEWSIDGIKATYKFKFSNSNLSLSENNVPESFIFE